MIIIVTIVISTHTQKDVGGGEKIGDIALSIQTPQNPPPQKDQCSRHQQEEKKEKKAEV